MPSLDLFSDVQFGDQDSIDSWLLAHAGRHDIYQKIASLQGIALPPTNFTEYPDDDWFARHLSAHQALMVFLQSDPTVSVDALADEDWSDADSFYDWQQMHNDLHDRLDQSFGLAT